MKTLAVMGSGNGGNFEAIVRQLQKRSDIKIVCLSNKEDAFILQRAKNLGIEHKYLPFDNNFEYFSKNKFDLVALAGYMRILPEKVLEKMGHVLNLHPSLLPAFKGSKNAIKDAFSKGVKVSGVTIHEVTPDVDSGKILAQYPVFIRNDMHFEEFEAEIHSVEHRLYPIVIEKTLDDKVFDFADLMKTECSGGCSGGCHSDIAN